MGGWRRSGGAQTDQRGEAAEPAPVQGAHSSPAREESNAARSAAGSLGYRCERIPRETEVWDTPPLRLTRRPGPAPGSISPARAAGPPPRLRGRPSRGGVAGAGEFPRAWGGGAPLSPVGWALWAEGAPPLTAEAGGLRTATSHSLKFLGQSEDCVQTVFCRQAGPRWGKKPLTGGDASGSVSRVSQPRAVFL